MPKRQPDEAIDDALQREGVPTDAEEVTPDDPGVAPPDEGESIEAKQVKP